MTGRLTDEELVSAAMVWRNEIARKPRPTDAEVKLALAVDALTELRSRRTLDLTAAEVEALLLAKAILIVHKGGCRNPFNPDLPRTPAAECDHALAILDRLLAANGGGE